MQIMWVEKIDSGNDNYINNERVIGP